MRAFRKRAGHVGRSSHKFSFALDGIRATGFSSPAQGLPDGAQAFLQVSRGPKVVATQPLHIVRGMVEWEGARMEWVCTLYTSKKSERPFSEKLFKLAILLVSDRKRPAEVAVTEVDIAEYASVDQVTSARCDVSFDLKPQRGSQARGAFADAAVGARLSMTLESTYLKDLAVDPDEESISSVQPRTGKGALASAAASFGSRSLAAGDHNPEQDLRGFDDGRGEDSSDESSVQGAVYEPTIYEAGGPAAGQPVGTAGEPITPSFDGGASTHSEDALARQFKAQAAALAAATGQLAELRAELGEARAAATAAASMATSARSPPPPLHSATMGRSATLELDLDRSRQDCDAITRSGPGSNREGASLGSSGGECSHRPSVRHMCRVACEEP